MSEEEDRKEHPPKGCCAPCSETSQAISRVWLNYSLAGVVFLLLAALAFIACTLRARTPEPFELDFRDDLDFAFIFPTFSINAVAMRFWPASDEWGYDGCEHGYRPFMEGGEGAVRFIQNFCAMDPHGLIFEMKEVVQVLGPGMRFLETDCPLVGLDRYITCLQETDQVFVATCHCLSREGAMRISSLAPMPMGNATGMVNTATAVLSSGNRGWGEGRLGAPLREFVDKPAHSIIEIRQHGCGLL